MSQPVDNAAVRKAYDDVPYLGAPYETAHPCRMAVMATLFGLDPVPPANARILELGGGAGEHLLPLAYELPHARFLGYDLSPGHTAAGRAGIARLGLRNVTLETCDILDIPTTIGPFDYILCHGVYSWVPEPVRRRILDICRRHLSPRGIAIVSYNVLPGWHLKNILRDLMCHRAQGLADPPAQLAAARAAVDLLAAALEVQGGPYSQMLAGYLPDLRSSDSYVIHEYLELHNQAFYLLDFVAQARAAGLDYLHDASYLRMPDDAANPVFAARLDDFAPDFLEREHFADILIARSFRSSLLVPAGAPVQRTPQYDRLLPLLIASDLAPEDPAADPRRAEPVIFRSRHGAVLRSAMPALTVALLILHSRRPAAVQISELWSLTRQRLPGLDLTFADFAHALKTAMAMHGTTLFPHPPRYVSSISDRPEASRVARDEARRQEYVTTLNHLSEPARDWGRELLLLCDGTRTRADLVNAIAEILPQRPSAAPAVQSLTPDQLRQFAAGIVEQGLFWLRDKPLLVA